MNDPVKRIRECLATGGDLGDVLNILWLEHEEADIVLSYAELNAFVIQAVKSMA